MNGGIFLHIFNRLNHLEAQVLNAFSPDFIFLVFPDKVQHFPARNFGPKETLVALNERLGENYQFATWHNYVIAFSPQQDLIAVLPRFEKISALQNA